MQALLALLLLLPAGAQDPPPSDQEMLAVFRAAVEHQQAGRVAEAEAEYQRFLVWQPFNIEALANLGALYAGLGRYDHAIAQYRKALERSYLNAPVRMNLALAFYKSARCVEALPEFDRVLEASPTLYNAIVLKADCLLQLGRYRDAVAVLEPLAPERAGDRAFNYIFGMALLQDEQTEAGLVHLDRILKEGDSAEAHLLLGLARRAAADYAGARDEFGKAVTLDPDLPMANSLHGQMLMSTGDRDAARQAFLRELGVNPNDFEANLLMGVLLKEDRDFAGARKFFSHAQSLRPGDPGVRYQMATLLLGTADAAGALAILEPLVAESPDFVEAHVSLATAYYRLGRKADGDRHREIVARLTAEAQARQPGPSSVAGEPQP